MIALKRNNYLNDLRRIQFEVDSVKKPSILKRILYYISIWEVKRRNNKINSILKQLLADLSANETNVTQEMYHLSKEVLFGVKGIELDCEQYPHIPHKISSILQENTSLAYNLEKIARTKFFKSQPKNEPSEFTKAVSSLSGRTTASKL